MWSYLKENLSLGNLFVKFASLKVKMKTKIEKENHISSDKIQCPFMIF